MKFILNSFNLSSINKIKASLDNEGDIAKRTSLTLFVLTYEINWSSTISSK